MNEEMKNDLRRLIYLSTNDLLQQTDVSEFCSKWNLTVEESQKLRENFDDQWEVLIHTKREDINPDTKWNVDVRIETILASSRENAMRQCFVRRGEKAVGARQKWYFHQA